MLKKKLNFLEFVAFLAIAASAMSLTEAHAAQTFDEAELIKIIKSDADKPRKALACKKLAVVGTDKAV